MKTTERKIMNEKIYNHGEELKRFFNLDPSVDPVKLSKQLFSLENKLHRWAEMVCNGDIAGTNEEMSEKMEYTYMRLLKILKVDISKLACVKMNLDPRGYFLKIESDMAKDWNGCKDWGGYGIIAPDFKEEA